MLTTKKGNQGDDFGKKLSNDSDLTPAQMDAAARQAKLRPIVKAGYLSSIGGEPRNTVEVRLSEINKGRWRITIYTKADKLPTDAVEPGPRVTHGDVVMVNDDGKITLVCPRYSKGRPFPMTDVGMSGKKWN